MKYKKYIYLFIIVVIAFIPLFDLFRPGLPITHDGQDHVARIANFYQNLTDGNIVPRWAGNLNWGYGHPILEFLYPLPSYVASLFHLLGFGLVDSVKFVFGLSFIASGLAMYVWLREFLGEKAAFVGSILYMFAPYRFIDLYVRGAIGESVAFVFPPLILYFIFKLYKEGKLIFALGGALSLSALILSHNAISIMFLPIILLYILYLYISRKSRNANFIFKILFIFILGLGLSSFFLLPALIEGKYTLRDIVTQGEYASRFVVNFKDFMYGSWSYGGTGMFSVQVGIIHWLMTLASLPVTFVLYKRRNKLWVLSLGLFVIFVSTLFLMMPYSKIIWEKITILQKFQFPWRFLSVIVFATAVLGGLFVSAIPKRFKLAVASFLLIAILFFNKDYWRAQGYLNKSERFFTNIYAGTTDTGESSPIWSVRFMEKKPKNDIEVISGDALIKEVKRISAYHEYEIEAKGKSRIRENTLYFPGWQVFVDGAKTNIEFQDSSSRGLITFFVDKGKHSIKVQFGETKLRFLADLISGISLILIFFYSILSISKLWQRFR